MKPYRIYDHIRERYLPGEYETRAIAGEVLEPLNAATPERFEISWVAIGPEPSHLDDMTAGQLCDLIDEAAQQLIERNEEAREAGAHELWPATTGAVTRGFYTSVPPSKRRKR